MVDERLTPINNKDRTMNKVMISRNEKDTDMVDIYSVTASGGYILWGVVHSDIMEMMSGDVAIGDLENMERELKVI